MARVYLIAAPGDTAAGDALAAWLGQRGFSVRTDFGRYQYPPLRGDEVLVMLWSRTALMSVKQLFLVNRAIDAWEAGRLVLARLDHGLPPRGLGDVDMVDLAFEPARVHRYVDVANAIRAIASPPPAAARSISIEPRAVSDEQALSDSQEDEAADAAEVLPVQTRAAGLGASARSAPSPPPPATLFVSYSSANRDRVWPIVDQVEALGVNVWVDRDDIQVGHSWARAIVQAIKAASRVALMCSEEAFGSDHVRRELYLADKYRKALVPVRLDRAEMPEDFEYFLIDKQWLDADDLSGPDGAATLRAVFGQR